MNRQTAYSSDYFDETRDTPRTRTILLDNGNKLHVTASDPYGLFTIHFDKGQIPESLSGQYTSYDEAMKAIKVYLQNKKKEIVEPKV